jgi:hypothetical protein
MPASNIPSVTLKRGEVKIKGEFTDMDNVKVTLLHIWLWQLGGNQKKGAGLATSALGAVKSHKTDKSKKLFELKTDKTSADRMGRFRPGAAIVSAIAVVSPDPPASDGRTQEVLHWGRSLTLVEGKSA